MRISTRGMTKASLFKFLWIGNLAGWFFFFLLCGIASLFGAETITFNQQPVTGAKGFVAALVMWPIFAAIFTCLQWVFFSFGFWLYSRFKHTELEFHDARITGGDLAGGMQNEG